ncbi:MAG: TIGR03905 family TSCPD domain-containing protein [Deltaproteobacteria bacterium]|jgi:uncharacterized protein (TIGR03905 family)|nr:TIGR03905 family TSCPD domain-containing protein [Deltaproteobacteria bacterium]
MRHDYPVKKICPRSLGFDIEGDILRNVTFAGGCPGNTQGLGRLAEGRNALEVARALDGITCGKKGRSCPGELSKAIYKAMGKRPPRRKAPAADGRKSPAGEGKAEAL